MSIDEYQPKHLAPPVDMDRLNEVIATQGRELPPLRRRRARVQMQSAIAPVVIDEFTAWCKDQGFTRSEVLEALMRMTLASAEASSD